MTLPINTHIPLGFRFHPTDEELIDYYLRKKVSSENSDLDLVIPDVDLNKLEPWDLCERCNMDIMYQTESYFFSHNDKKFLTGKRTNRATTAGFWKATGRDKAIYSGSLCIGMRKTLVFYRGRAPNTEKTDWILHEYRLGNGDSGLQSNEDGWVVCRIFKKHNVQEKAHQSCSNISEEEQSGTVANAESSINSQQSSAVVHTWFCKKEEEDCPPQVAFSKLQHLESSKITANMLCYNYNDLARTFTEDHKVVEDSALFLKSPSMKRFNSKSLYMPEDNIPGYVDNGLLTDWNMFENPGLYFPNFSNFTGDIPHCLHSSEQLPSECSSSCEVNLWNFTP